MKLTLSELAVDQGIAEESFSLLRWCYARNSVTTISGFVAGQLLFVCIMCTAICAASYSLHRATLLCFSRAVPVMVTGAGRSSFVDRFRVGAVQNNMFFIKHVSIRGEITQFVANAI